MLKKIVVAAVMATTLSSSLSAIAAPSVQVGFSPEGTARELVLSTIHHARESVRMMGYNFTAADIAKALASASRRGVDVKVILDNRENQNKYSKAALNILVNAGVNVRLTDAYKIHHDKVIIIDQNTVETGSFNFSKAAEYSNSENVLVLNDMPQVASVYLEHWQSRWDTGREWKSTY